MGTPRLQSSPGPGCILSRLTRDWERAQRANKIKDLGTIIRLASVHCDDQKGIKSLNKWVEYLETKVNIIPLKDLPKILGDIKYARKRLQARNAKTKGRGKFLEGTLSAVSRRAAARTLNNRLVANLTSDQLAPGNDTDLDFERRFDGMDTE